MTMERWNRLWWPVFNFTQRKMRGGLKLCANRVTRTFVIGKLEVDIVFRDTSRPDAYSREEVYEMLRKVRRDELQTGWTCPEPTL